VTSTAAFQPPLDQIAFSVIDLRRTERWFREGLGFLPAGGSSLLMSSPVAGRVQGLPGAASTCWWLVGRNPWFQIEMFQFRRPVAKLMPAGFRPCDTGYTRIGVHVSNFDVTLKNLQRLESHPIAPAVGDRGRRRACVRNPDGVYVEIMEDDPLPGAVPGERECRAAMRSVTLSTPDLESTVDYLRAVTGREPADIDLHGEEHEALWGLQGARCRRAVFVCGDVLVEAVQYLDPAGTPWPAGYRICDQGILNIAFGARSRRDHEAVCERATRFGANPNCKPVQIPGAGVVYFNDRLGFSIEVLWTRPGNADAKWGFQPQPLNRRPHPDNRRVEARVSIQAPLDLVWQVLNDHARMAEWIGFERVERRQDGTPDPDGYGCERRLQGRPGTVMEQITGVEPGRAIRYRVIEGSPLIYHNGEVVISDGTGQTQVHWAIRFRSRLPLLGGLLERMMQRLLENMLRTGLKPHVERLAGR